MTTYLKGRKRQRRVMKPPTQLELATNDCRSSFKHMDKCQKTVGHKYNYLESNILAPGWMDPSRRHSDNPDPLHAAL